MGQPNLPPSRTENIFDKGEDPKVFGKKAIGPTYNMLRPEVKQCLDKVMYQLDLCKNTLGLLDKRISNSELNLQAVMEFIRTEDINYVSPIHCYLTLATNGACLETLFGPSNRGGE